MPWPKWPRQGASQGSTSGGIPEGIDRGHKRAIEGAYGNSPATLADYASWRRRQP